MTMSSYRTGVYASAVCVYSIEQIEAAFLGAYRYQENSKSLWSSVQPSASYAQVRVVYM